MYRNWQFFLKSVVQLHVPVLPQFITNTYAVWKRHQSNLVLLHHYFLWEIFPKLLEASNYMTLKLAYEM